MGKCYFYNKVLQLLLQHFENYVVLEATAIPKTPPLLPCFSPPPFERTGSNPEKKSDRLVFSGGHHKQPSSPEATTIAVAPAVGARVALVRWILQATPSPRSVRRLPSPPQQTPCALGHGAKMVHLAIWTEMRFEECGSSKLQAASGHKRSKRFLVLDNWKLEL
ncbi:hypothetical protein Acr_13g0007160 [Actinidia rufa]|uniref:Uncharacterized protein n=1 Tax=Actinidia rufa TaxID=165716 RepID=A0A7J0FKT4_9ERIC|nr:hypothetical protein Acr_13g0007160 [Actinidia rufa]